MIFLVLLLADYWTIDYLPLGRQKLAVAREYVYLLDADERQVVVIDNGREVYRFGSRGQGPGELNQPSAIDVLGDFVYVVDGNVLHRFDTKGRFIERITSSVMGAHLRIADGWIAYSLIEVSNPELKLTRVDDQGIDRPFQSLVQQPGGGDRIDLTPCSSWVGVSKDRDLVLVHPAGGFSVSVFDLDGAHIRDISPPWNFEELKEELWA